MLKGKALQDFSDWFYDNDKIYDVCTSLIDDMTGNIQMFWKLPQTMQQGVLLQFFRENGIDITIRFGLTAGYYCEISEDDENDDIVLSDFENYSTAFTHAIDKACEVYNGGEG